MHSDDSKNLIPQLEEGITEVAFKNNDEIEMAFKNTYPNIKMVYESYLNIGVF